LRRLLWPATAGIPVTATTTTASATFAGTFVEFLATTSAAPSASALVFALRASAAHFGLLAAGHHAHTATLLGRLPEASAISSSLSSSHSASVRLRSGMASNSCMRWRGETGDWGGCESFMECIIALYTATFN
jgi:hypothetical protein